MASCRYDSHRPTASCVSVSDEDYPFLKQTDVIDTSRLYTFEETHEVCYLLTMATQSSREKELLNKLLEAARDLEVERRKPKFVRDEVKYERAFNRICTVCLAAYLTISTFLYWIYRDTSRFTEEICKTHNSKLYYVVGCSMQKNNESVIGLLLFVLVLTVIIGTFLLSVASETHSTPVPDAAKKTPAVDIAKLA